jgi:hypothetical protein
MKFKRSVIAFPEKVFGIESRSTTLFISFFLYISKISFFFCVNKFYIRPFCEMKLFFCVKYHIGNTNLSLSLTHSLPLRHLDCSHTSRSLILLSHLSLTISLSSHLSSFSLISSLISLSLLSLCLVSLSPYPEPNFRQFDPYPSR